MDRVVNLVGDVGDSIYPMEEKANTDMKKDTSSPLKEMPQADRSDLMDEAQKAFDEMPPSNKIGPFSWRGNTYITYHTGFRLKVETPAGKPVCCRWD